MSFNIHNKTKPLSDEDLPFNTNNVLIPKSFIKEQLELYGVDSVITDKDYKGFLLATTHRSYCTFKNTTLQVANEKCPENCIPLQSSSMEKLEFLGDAILQAAVTIYLSDRYFEDQDVEEDFVSRIRVEIVKGRALSNFAKTLGLDKYVIMSKQVEDKGGRTNFHILEDSFEAFLAAIFKAKGFEACRVWITNFLEENVDFSELAKNKNYKDIFVKAMNQKYGYNPQFFDIEKDNTNLYHVNAKDPVNNVIMGFGKGETKKEAQHEASKMALNKYFT